MDLTYEQINQINKFEKALRSYASPSQDDIEELADAYGIDYNDYLEYENNG